MAPTVPRSISRHDRFCGGRVDCVTICDTTPRTVALDARFVNRTKPGDVATVNWSNWYDAPSGQVNVHDRQSAVRPPNCRSCARSDTSGAWSVQYSPSLGPTAPARSTSIDSALLLTCCGVVRVNSVIGQFPNA